MTTNRLGTPLSQPTDIPTAIPIGQPTGTDSVTRSDQASHGRTDGRTDEELPHPGSESSRNASPAGGLEEIHHPPSETTAQTSQPLNSEPAQGPVEGRSVAEIRADLALARFVVVNGRPEATDAWHRLARDVPSLLAEVEAAHRFEQSAAGEREELLAEVAELRELADAARLLGPARRVLDMAAEGEAPAEECAAMAQRIVDLIGHPVTDEPPHAIVERDSLRGVVQAVDWEIADEIRACELAGDRAGTDLMSRPVVIGHLRRIRERVAALAAAADAPQPADEPTKCAACGRPKNAHSPTRTGGYLTGHRFIDPKDVCHHTIEEGCTGHGDF